MARHIIADDLIWNSILFQFPGGEPGPLQQGPRFVGINVNLPTGFNGGKDDGQRGPVISGRQAAGVAQITGKFCLPRRRSRREALPPPPPVEPASPLAGRRAGRARGATQS